MGVKSFFKKIFYSLPFAMKGGEKILTSTNDNSSNNMGVVEVIQENRLSKDLLKGEVTQAVEELRYRDYKVYGESKKYQYLGDGIAIKTKNQTDDNKNKFFIVENKVICENVYDELKRIDSYSSDRYVLSILYHDIPKFKLESYASRLEVNIVDGVCDIVLCFPKYSNKYDVKTKAFINELGKIVKGDMNYLLKNHEICTNMSVIDFTTYKAINEDDFIQYTLYNLECVGCVKEQHEFKLMFKVHSYKRENLLSRFYSPTMEAKYQAKQSKDVMLSLVDSDRICKCEMCGLEINKYDADITKETIGKSLCKNCLEKKIIDNFSEGVDKV